MKNLQMSNAPHALVVEGGAMRGIFAAGVLDSFLDNQFIPFDFCMGVSSGSTNLAGFLAGQRGRSHKLITDYSCRSEFINPWRYLRGGHYLDLDWLWDISDREYPIDYATYRQRNIPFWVVTTNAVTGKPIYHRPAENDLSQTLMASCALPLAYRDFPTVKGERQADGGLADSIPVIEAYKQGAREITVILSRPKGFRMRQKRSPSTIRFLLNKYPALAEATVQRHKHYNTALDFIEKPPEDCKVNLLVPSSSFEVSRMTTDRNKLNAGYEMGISAGTQFASIYDNSQTIN